VDTHDLSLKAIHAFDTFEVAVCVKLVEVLAPYDSGSDIHVLFKAIHAFDTFEDAAISYLFNVPYTLSDIQAFDENALHAF
jgi:hypothetical protein